MSFLKSEPTADDIAWAMIEAARYTGEGDILRGTPEGFLTGVRSSRARWLGLAALYLVWGAGAVYAMAHLWCPLGQSPFQIMHRMHRRAWWSDAIVAQIAAERLMAHGILVRPSGQGGALTVDDVAWTVARQNDAWF